MSVGGHDPEGESLCIHSVVIDNNYQRQQLGVFLIQKYLQFQSIFPRIHQCLLLAHHDKLRLYEKVGFVSKGPSKVIHGAEEWIEMVYRFGSSIRSHCSSMVSNIHVNAFTLLNPSLTKLYTGNPAAVVVLPYHNTPVVVNNIEDGYPSSEWCQLLAKENNLSETAFILPRNDGTFTIRWWTPGNEVALCGHATLASAKVLFAENYVPLKQRTLIFHSRSGTLYATKEKDNYIELNFPVEALVPMDTHSAEYKAVQTSLSKAFAIPTDDILYIGKNAWDIITEITTSSFHTLNFSGINIDEINTIDCRGIAVTCQGTETVTTENFDPENPPATTTVSNETNTPCGHFLSRWFGPRVAVPEDPVTGSAHCALYPFWEQKFVSSTSSSMNTMSPWLLAYQASPRGGQLWIHRKNNRIFLRGQAQITCTKYLRKEVIQEHVILPI